MSTPLSALHDALNRLRSVTPSADLVIVAAPDALDAFWELTDLPKPRRPLGVDHGLKLMVGDQAVFSHEDIAALHVTDEARKPGAGK